MCFGNLEIADDESLLSRFLSEGESATRELDHRASESTYRDRRVYLTVSVADDDTRIQVAHDGPGKLIQSAPLPIQRVISQ